MWIIVALGSLPTASTQAARFDPNGFRLESSHLYVHENAGTAQIAIVRNDTSENAQIRYITVAIGHRCGAAQCTALPPYDYSPVKAMLDFPVGVARETFEVPIVDHHSRGLPVTIQVALFGPSPIGMATPSSAVLTILGDDAPAVRDPHNPLGLTVPPPANDPLQGASFFVDHESNVAQLTPRYPGLRVISSQPGTARFGKFSGRSVGLAVQRYLDRAEIQEPGTVPMLSTYRIVDGDCVTHGDTPAEAAQYHNFVEDFAHGIGDHRGVLFLEMDSIITAPCLKGFELELRMRELRDAIDVLTSNCPRLVIYLDGGAADANSVAADAQFLRRAGVAKIQGFFLNSTHFDWTSKEIAYGEAVSRLIGGKHFVVNTGEAGRGPMIPRDRVHQGNEVLCDPPGRGLGPTPTADTGYPNVDAFAWTSNPGESDGSCGHYTSAPPPGAYWPDYGLMLIRNADPNVDNHRWPQYSRIRRPTRDRRRTRRHNRRVHHPKHVRLRRVSAAALSGNLVQ